MTTINDQPQHLLARYADRTGAKWEYIGAENDKPSPRCKWVPPTKGLSAGHYVKAKERGKYGFIIRLVLSEYGLPSHLKPYKDNPRLPGEGYRVPTGEDSCNQPHKRWSGSRGKWVATTIANCSFSEVSAISDMDYLLPASVLPPDWDEMTREDAPADASPHPEIFEANGLEWYRHTPGDPMPCDGELKVGVTLRNGGYDSLGYGLRAKAYGWDEQGESSAIGWRPADAPAKLTPNQQRN